jgi:hypothetical protein
MKPLNAIAETIVKLESEIENDSRQVEFYTARITANEATVEQLTPLAEWEPENTTPPAE